MSLETLPAYCLTCGKFLGDITGTSQDLTNVNPLCYKCLKEYIPKLPKFRQEKGILDLVIVNE